MKKICAMSPPVMSSNINVCLLGINKISALAGAGVATW